MSRFVSRLNLKNGGSKILSCREGRHSSSDTKEGGWNRKIHRANEPAKYAPDKGRQERAPVGRTIPGGAPIRKIGTQSEGSRPRWVAARRNYCATAAECRVK